jgi:hypothetical protein
MTAGSKRSDLDRSYDFSLERDATASEIVATVQTYGLAHINGYLDRKPGEALANEATTVLDDQSAWVNHEEYGLGKAVRLVRREIDQARYPGLVDVFGNGFFEDIARRWYGRGTVFAEQIWVMVDVPESRTIVQEFHYDKVEHLKHMLYLSDVTEEHGPFHCVAGSQGIAKGLQAENRAAGIIPTDTEARILPEDLQASEMPVVGRRGTLIVFDSDIAHRASVPAAGDRLVARSLTFGSSSLGQRI